MKYGLVPVNRNEEFKVRIENPEGMQFCGKCGMEFCRECQLA
jgi:hypothetical protein